jgi:OOP family OmpA-OmpF porin
MSSAELIVTLSISAIVLLDVIETRPMEARMVTTDAAAMAEGIATTGRVALYGIYVDTDRTDIKPESAPTLREIARCSSRTPP